jgi:hypothetical protein
MPKRKKPKKVVEETPQTQVVEKETKVEFKPKEYMKIMSSELHKPVKKKFKRNKVYVSGMDEVWAADLADMSQEAEDGYRYILTVVDVLSKYAWARPIKTKEGKVVANELKGIIKESGRKPKNIWADEGKEFYNKDVANLGVRVYSTYGPGKASVVERFNKTLKEKLWKKFDENNDRNWLEILPEVMREYNSTKHSTTGMTPVEASKKENEKKLVKKQLGKEVPKRKPAKFEIGDWVRISRVKKTFEKGYIANWSRETFKVASRSYYVKEGIWKYYLDDYAGEPIKGTFYEEELQKTALDDVYLVEKTISKNKKTGEEYVKWLGYPESFNSTIKATDTVHEFVVEPVPQPETLAPRGPITEKKHKIEVPEQKRPAKAEAKIEPVGKPYNPREALTEQKRPVKEQIEAPAPTRRSARVAARKK